VFVLSKSSFLVQKAVEVALALGYQINPDALKLLQMLTEERRSNLAKVEPTLESIVREVIKMVSVELLKGKI
jgi:hypothetical protein